MAGHPGGTRWLWCPCPSCGMAKAIDPIRRSPFLPFSAFIVLVLV
jgi:hypothetical protein